MARKRDRKKQALRQDPTPDELRKALQATLSLAKDPGTFHHRAGERRKLVLLWGFTGHALAHAEAAMQLSTIAHLAVCAQANARIAYEHATLAQYAHLHPQGLEHLEHLVSFGGYRLAKEVLELSVDQEIRAFAAAQAETRVKEPDIARMKALLKKFDRSGQMYLPYKTFSQSVHPSGSTMLGYLELAADRDSAPVGLADHQAVSDLSPVLWLATLSAILAVGVREDLRRAKPNKAALRKIAAGVGMSPLLELPPDQP